MKALIEEWHQSKKLYAEIEELKAKSFIDYIIEVSLTFK